MSAAHSSQNADSRPAAASPEGMEDDRAYFDPEQMIERLGNDSSLVPAVLQICIDDFPLQAAQLKLWLESGRYDQARWLAHSLKGAAGTASFNRLAQLASAVEDFVAAGNGALALALASSVRELALDSVARAQTYLAQLDPPARA